MNEQIAKLFCDDEGAMIVEYALVVLLIAAACVALIGNIGGAVQVMFTRVAPSLVP